LTAWYRAASETTRTATEGFVRAHLPEFELFKLSGEEEALKESIAVQFAAEHAGIGKPSMQVFFPEGSLSLSVSLSVSLSLSLSSI
jgi:hypothetical protein